MDQLGTKVISAKNLYEGQWILYKNSRMNQRVVGVEKTKDGLIKVYHDGGHGGEPATSFYEPDERLQVC